MTAEQFIKERQEKAKKEGKDYGICLPPTEAQEAVNILIEHFLGKGWYTTLSMNAAQVNTQAVYEILDKYPEKKTFREHLKALTGR